MERFDAGVVGLGMMGSGALRHLTRLLPDCSVVGIGPAAPLRSFAEHEGAFASHYDSGRITRVLDRQWQWGLLAQRAIAEYSGIEAASGIDFHRPAGLIIGVVDTDEADDIQAVGDRLGVATRRVAPGAVATIEPRYRFPAGNGALVEAVPAGHIDPQRMIAAQLAVAEQARATVIRREAASIAAADGGWRVGVDGREIAVDRLIVAAGPHTDELAGLPVEPDLRVHAETIIMAHIGPAEQERLAGLPAGIVRFAHDAFYEDAYFVPPTTYPDGTVRFKLGATMSDLHWLHTGAERRAWMRSDEHLDHLPAMRAIVEDLIPGLVADRWETRPCLITQTPGRLPYVEHIADRLVLAAGGNGYAAKSGDAIGALAARLLVEERWTDPDLSEDDFRMQVRL